MLEDKIAFEINLFAVESKCVLSKLRLTINSQKLYDWLKFNKIFEKLSLNYQ